MQLANITFTVYTDSCNETWFQSDQPLTHEQLEEAVQQLGVTPKWFSPEHGNFSTYDTVEVETA